MAIRENTYLRLEPDVDVDFKIDLSSLDQFGSLTLYNNNTSSVVFRFSKHPSDLSITPETGVLSPQETIQVSMVLKNRKRKEGGKMSFQIKVAPVDDKYVTDSDVKACIKRADSSSLQKHAIHVKYHADILPESRVQESVPQACPVDPHALPKLFLMPAEPEPEKVASVPVASRGGTHYLRPRRDLAFSKRAAALRGDLYDTSNLDPLYKLGPVPPSSYRKRAYPQYQLHLEATPTGEVIAQGAGQEAEAVGQEEQEPRAVGSELSIGQRLIKKCSNLDQMLKKVTDEAKKLQMKQKSTIIAFGVVVALLVGLFFFLVLPQQSSN